MFRLLLSRFKEQIEIQAKEQDNIVDIYPLLRYLATAVMTHSVRQQRGPQHLLGQRRSGDDGLHLATARDTNLQPTCYFVKVIS